MLKTNVNYLDKKLKNLHGLSFRLYTQNYIPSHIIRSVIRVLIVGVS